MTETMTVGSLFTGYGGLDMAVEEFFGAETAWFSEVAPAAVKVYEHHNPSVPNLGDITKIDWTATPAVDIMCGGSPCQDMSTAGIRAGMLNGTRSGLWENMREGIATLRPKYVVWENVKGAFSAKAYSEVEQSEGRVGGIRALGRVVGDLADLGYDCRWGVVRASDAGAPHRRERVFILAARGGLGLPTPLAHDAVQGLSPAALKRRTPDLPAIALILMRGGASIVWSWRDGLPDWLPWHLIRSEGGAGTDT